MRSTSRMKMSRQDLLLGRAPDSVRAQAAALGLSDGGCLFSARSDLGLGGEDGEVWLVVARDVVVALAAGEDGVPASGPFSLPEVGGIRIHQTVGSAFLQAELGGLYVDVVRFSNARRETFDRVRVQLERLIAGEPLQDDVLQRHSERSCAACGLQLRGRGASCPRCRGGHGVFLRTLILMRPYWLYSLLILAMRLVRVGLGLVPPYLVRILVDRILEPRAHGEWLGWFVAGLLGVAAVVCFVSVLVGRASSGVGARIGKELRRVLQQKLLGLDVEYFDRHSVGSLMSRVLWDTEYFHTFVHQVSEGFLLSLTMVLGIGVMLFYMNWRLALMVLLPLPFVVVGTTLFWRHIYPLYYPVWESQSKMAQLLSSVLSGIRMVKAFGQEEREGRRFDESAEHMRGARYALEGSVAAFYPVMAFVFGFGGLIIWYYGGSLVLKGQISLGTLMAFFSYVAMFYGPVHALSMFSNWTTGFLSAGRRIFEVLDGASSLQEPPHPVRMPEMGGGIEFRNVTFGYDPYNPVIKDVSFRVEPGQFIGVVGKSGSGKTTLVNLVCRFYDVQQGQVLIDGVDVRELSREDLRKQVALVLQEPFLFRASIKDNIAYGHPEADPMTVVNAAKAANAHDFIAKLPGAYDTRLGEYGAGLSGGERQRVTIARALVRRPKILILDEATSSVDTESERGIQRGLAELSKGCTTIAIAHRLSTLKNADRIYVLDEGRIAEAGAHEELMARRGVYERLVRIQTELARMEAS